MGGQSFYPLLFGKVRNTNACVRLAMTLFLCVATLLSVADDRDLLVETGFYELCSHCGTLDVWSSYNDFRAIVGQEDLVESNFGAGFCFAHRFNVENAVLRDNILFAASFYNRYLCHIGRRTITHIPIAGNNTLESHGFGADNCLGWEKGAAVSKAERARWMRRIVAMLRPETVSEIAIVEASETSWMAQAVMSSGPDKRFRFVSGHLYDEATIGDARVA